MIIHSDIDKRLDEIITRILKDDPWTLAEDELIEFSNNWKQAIKQLMVDEFEKLIGEVSKDFKPELIDMAHKDYHPDIAPGFSIGFNLAKKLITDRATKKLKEWKEGV